MYFFNFIIEMYEKYVLLCLGLLRFTRFVVNTVFIIFPIWRLSVGLFKLLDFFTVCNPTICFMTFFILNFAHRVSRHYKDERQYIHYNVLVQTKYYNSTILGTFYCEAKRYYGLF